MEFAQIVDQVRSKLDDEAVAKALGESNVTEINSALRTLKSDHADVRDALSHANSESKARKLKIREMTTEAESLTDEIEGLKGKANTGEEDATKLETELAELKKFKADTVGSMRKGFLTNFGQMADHPNFVKAKEFFTLPAVDDKGNLVKAEDGSFDFSKVSDEQMEANIAKAGELATLGYFEKKDDSTNKGSGDLGSRQDGEGLLGQIGKAKTMAELEALTEN